MSDTPNQTPEQPDENPKRVQLTQTASNLITGQRQEDYGTPEKNFTRVANYWSIRLEDKLKDGAKITPREVAELMALLKMARATQSPTEDSFVDGIGYIAIAGELGDLERKYQKVQEDGYTELAKDEERNEEQKSKLIRRIGPFESDQFRHRIVDLDTQEDN